MTYLLIPPHLMPRTAFELYRLVMSVPAGRRVRITAIEDGVVHWRTLP